MYESKATSVETAQPRLRGGLEEVTLSAAYTFTAASPTYLRADPDGANRDMNLMSVDKSEGFFVQISHIGSADNLVVKDADANTIATITNGQTYQIALYDTDADNRGDAWRATRLA